MVKKYRTRESIHRLKTPIQSGKTFEEGVLPKRYRYINDVGKVRIKQQQTQTGKWVVHPKTEPEIESRVIYGDKVVESWDNFKEHIKQWTRSYLPKGKSRKSKKSSSPVNRSRRKQTVTAVKKAISPVTLEEIQPIRYTLNRPVKVIPLVKPRVHYIPEPDKNFRWDHASMEHLRRQVGFLTDTIKDLKQGNYVSKSNIGKAMMIPESRGDSESSRKSFEELNKGGKRTYDSNGQLLIDGQPAKKKDVVLTLEQKKESLQAELKETLAKRKKVVDSPEKKPKDQYDPNVLANKVMKKIENFVNK